MRPLIEWNDDARDLAEAQFCARHKEPVLIHWSSHTISVENTGVQTMDRFIMRPNPKTVGASSMIESYKVGILRTDRSSKAVWVGSSSRATSSSTIRRCLGSTRTWSTVMAGTSKMPDHPPAPSSTTSHQPQTT